MTMQANRIYFSGNPYPNGHKIVEFVWSGRVDEDKTIWFDFHLTTDEYYAEDDSDDVEGSEPLRGWNAKGVWGNYHACILSSTYWDEPGKGIKVNDGSGKFDLDRFLQKKLRADSLPVAIDRHFAFNIYLLGHDDCADHSINITRLGDNRFDIKWTGKIALTYSGDYEFKYDFIASLQNVSFEGLHCPDSWSVEQAESFFSNKLEDFDKYELLVNAQSNKIVCKPKRA